MKNHLQTLKTTNNTDKNKIYFEACPPKFIQSGVEGTRDEKRLVLKTKYNSGTRN